MTLGQTFQWAYDLLKSNNIDDPQIETNVLLCYALKLSLPELYNHWDKIISINELETLTSILNRRINREPTAYITNHKEFYGIDFYVDNRVLIPRPETELLVEVSSSYLKKQDFTDCNYTVIDVGTGCGAIAICLALSFPLINCIATDNSATALEVVRLNLQRRNISSKVTLILGHLLEPIEEPADLIIANLPYIPTTDIRSLSPEIYKFEPVSALDGGQNGTEIIEELLGTAVLKMKSHGIIILEIGIAQAETVLSLIDKYYRNKKIIYFEDFNGIKRVVSIEL